MPESKRIYRVSSLDLAEINRVLSQIADRLDELEGYRGQPTMRDRLAVVDDDGNIIQSLGGTE